MNNLNNDSVLQTNNFIPAPWDLNGKGYIILYKFNKNFSEKLIENKTLQKNFSGGLGCVMIVDYQNSNAGPYGELLFIPGKFYFDNKKLYSISKIYVSTSASVINGRKNWGIPKELANFNFAQVDKNTEKIEILDETNKNKILSITLKSFGIPFPVNTKLLPFPLFQVYDNKTYFVNFFGKGKGKLSSILDFEINANLFPDVSMIKPLLIIKVDPFDITFPIALIKDGENYENK